MNAFSFHSSFSHAFSFSLFSVHSSIKSPFVVYFYGAVIEPQLWMVMENCSLGSLYKVLNDSSTPIHWNRFFSFAIECASGILALHSHNPPIYHRDVKTLNFLVNKEYHVKVSNLSLSLPHLLFLSALDVFFLGIQICDFGLSRFNTVTNLATMNKICGTIHYLAPEVYMGEKYTSKADIYSLGIVLWELITRTMNGKYAPPYSEYEFNFDWQILLAVSQNGKRPTLPKNSPEQFQQLYLSMVHTDPLKRPEAEEVIQRLEQTAQHYVEHKEEWDRLLEGPRDCEKIDEPVLSKTQEEPKELKEPNEVLNESKNTTE
jgi:serine/threonine protein kinase